MPVSKWLKWFLIFLPILAMGLLARAWAQGATQAPANLSEEKGKSWTVRFYGPTTILPKNTPVTLTVSREWIIVRDSRGFSRSIPAADVRTTDSHAQVRKATKGWEAVFDDPICCVADSGLQALFIAPSWLADKGNFPRLRTTNHFVSIYWVENGSVSGLEFCVSAGDAKSLLPELRKATGRNAEDIQQSSSERQNMIAQQYEESPIVEIKSSVTLGWDTLWPGHYRMIVLPRSVIGETGLAEVYFFAANEPTPDLISGDAVAEFERPKTPMEGKASPRISYREQNGIVTFSQIETDEYILRFTLVPLGSANYRHLSTC